MSEVIRVLQVVTHMNRGGLETMLMNYYRHIDKSKVQFDFLVHREARAAYDDEIEQLGGRIYRLSRLVPWSSSYLRSLRSFFKAHPEYKIVHAHQDCLSGVILKAAKEVGIPVRIAHSHSSSQDKDFKFPIKLYYKRWIPRYATHLFACGKAAGDWMFNGHPYQVIYNAINTNEYLYDQVLANNIREEMRIPQNAFVVGHVGRFSGAKNHTFLIDIFAEIKKRNTNSVLLLVGDGELRATVEKKICSLKLEEAVVFTGVRTDVPRLLQAMDVFVFPSLYEGLPVTIIEAQAAGLPCIISDKVPLECRITETVTQVSLSQTVEDWTITIINAKKAQRCDNTSKAASAGFDIHVNAEKLQQFYLGAVK